jgi:hypothetical protein
MRRIGRPILHEKLSSDEVGRHGYSIVEPVVPGESKTIGGGEEPNGVDVE